MKKLISLVLIAIACVAFGFTRPALAAGNPEAGAKVFNAICAACHLGGGNVVQPAKTLKLPALQANGIDSLEAIVKQVTYGKAAMPAFKGRLTEEQIADVAAYVLGKANKGW